MANQKDIVTRRKFVEKAIKKIIKKDRDVLGRLAKY